jgi:hypothetical protein
MRVSSQSMVSSQSILPAVEALLSLSVNDRVWYSPLSESEEKMTYVSVQSPLGL